jgi:phage/plasmid primase-like uncharacterized protein
MSLRTIVETLGGDLYDGGRRASIPAPGHSAKDRSVSLLLEGDRLVVHSFGDGDWRAVLEHLRERHLIDDANTPVSCAGACEPRTAVSTDAERRKAASRLWAEGAGIADTLSERHCRLRSVSRPLPGPDALRHHSAAPVSAYADKGLRRPAMIAAIRDADGSLCAVEITYLNRRGERAMDLRLSRKTVGQAPAGCAVRLDTAAPEMLVGEGVFTTLSASEHFCLPAWALLSVRNLQVWSPPNGMNSVLIAADRGTVGEASADALRSRLVANGVTAVVALPPKPFGDWNDWAAARAAAKG